MVSKSGKIDKETPREQALIKLTHNRLAALQSQFQKNALPYATGMHFEEQSKYVVVDVPTKKFDSLEFLHLTDVQLGHILCDTKRVIEYRDWILAEPNRFMLWGGDMIDAGTKLSVGSPWEQACEPQGQVYNFCDLWAPARHRVLGYVGGNHERRGVPTFGDLGSLLAHLLRVPYSAGQQFVNINYGKHQNFKFFLWHGRGNAKTPGAKMMMIYYALKELSAGAQVTLVGHLHTPMLIMPTIREHDGMNLRVVDRKSAGAMSSSFLEYFGSYAEVAGLSPSSLIMARIVLTPDGKWEITLR